jgi:hypothetical protein
MDDATQGPIIAALSCPIQLQHLLQKLIPRGELMKEIVVESVEAASNGDSVTIEFRAPRKIAESIDDSGVIRACSHGTLYTFTFSARHSIGANLRRLKAYYAKRSEALARFSEHASARGMTAGSIQHP